jgi:hypothetical protein
MSSKDLTTTQAANLLGVTSPATMKNWLEGGNFPGAYLTSEGYWAFPLVGVLEAKARMDEIREKNRTGDLSPPDCDDDLDLPAL